MERVGLGDVVIKLLYDGMFTENPALKHLLMLCGISKYDTIHLVQSIPMLGFRVN